jgi:hypothetical protein
MSLQDFQTALGGSILFSNRSTLPGYVGYATPCRAQLGALVDTPGFRFTVDVQRSWCAGRAAKGARLTLSILDVDTRRRLLDTWVAAGGGTASLFSAEADAFLEFIASHLPNPSHALTVCRLEQAILRAGEGARQSGAVSLTLSPGTLVRTGRYAALVRFHADPDQLLAALRGGIALPPVSPTSMCVLFAPGLEGISRVATVDDVALWERLHEQPPPSTVMMLLHEGYSVEAIEDFVAIGAIESVPSP